MRVENPWELHCLFPDRDDFWTQSNLPELERSLLQKTPSIRTLTNLARVLNFQDKPQEAKKTLAQARELFLHSKNEEKNQDQLRLLIEEGRHLSLAMVVEKAHKLFLEAWLLAKDSPYDFFATEAAFLLSICLPPRFQEQWIDHAISKAKEKRDDAELWLGHLYLRKGWQLFDLRQYIEALSFFQSAWDLPHSSKERLDINRVKWSVAKTFRLLEQFKQALDLQIEIRDDFNQRNIQNGYVYWELAECFQRLDKANEAKKYFALAHLELSKNLWFSDNKTSELARMKEIGNKK